MSNKSDKCKRGLSKSTPGLECSKCERIVHLNTSCTGLTNKQIAALKAAPSLEWTCLECQQESPNRRTSIIIPEEDEEVNDQPVQINTKRLLNDVSKEVEKAIKREMKELNESLQFHSAKLDEVVECIEVFKKTINTLERKNTELTNKNHNLELRVGALEQRLQEVEQEKLNKFMEIANIPNIKNEEVIHLVENVAQRLKQSKNDIESMRKMQGRKDQPTTILVELKDENVQEKWAMAAKGTRMSAEDVHPTEKSNNHIIYVREAMTKLNKQIYWNAKQELKINHNYKYIWFKKGFVRVRKDDNEKAFILRKIEDIQIAANSKLQKKNY